jgi:hypothetical protein
MKPLVWASGLTVLGAILALSRTVPAAELKGDYQRGAHDISGQDVRLFAFTLTGALSGQAIEPERHKVFQQLQNTNMTAVKVARSATATYRTPVSLRKGEIFVFGWWNTKKGTFGWIAADTNGAEYPIHRWLSKDGAYGVLDTSTGEKHVVRGWKIDGKRVVDFELDASAGWLKWYVTAAGE